MQSKSIVDASSGLCPERLVSALIDAQVCVWSEIDQAAKTVPKMSAARYLVLSRIVNHPEGIGVTELARIQRITDGAASKLCERLELDGLVTRQRIKNDKRRHVIVATPHGNATFEEARKYVDQAASQFFSALTSEECRQLMNMLCRLSLAR